MDVSVRSTNNSPIALFVYNRPLHTRSTVEALLQNAEAKESDLIIYSDAAKTNISDLQVNETRTYIRSISGFKSILIIEHSENLGLAKSIMDGVTTLCAQYGRVIVIEDDLIVSPHFLNYMNSALNQYNDVEKVMQIAGYMFPMKAGDEINVEAIFLPFISSWGWATWQRAWRHYDESARYYKKLNIDSNLKWRFDLNGNYKYFKMLKAQQQGKIESWAIRWYLSVFFENGLVLYPAKTLVSNNGFDGSGVNCAVSTIIEKAIDVNFKVRHLPNIIEPSSEYHKVIKNMPIPKLSIASIIKRIKIRIMSK